MSRMTESTFLRYGIAVVGVVIATALRIALHPIIGGRFTFTTYYAVIVCVAWYGGLGPSLLSLALSALSAHYLFLPWGSGGADGLEARVGTLLFAMVGLALSFMGGAMRSARREAEANAREVSLHLKAEHEIRQRLDTTLQSIGDAVLAADAGGRVVSMNRVAEALTGWTTNEATGKPLEEVFRVFYEGTGEPVETPVSKVLRTGTIVNLANHTALVAKDGTTRPIDESAAPIRGVGGAVEGVVLVFRDVSARREAERSVRENEARKVAIVKAALDCIITIDHDGKIVEFNPAAQATFGYDAAEVLGCELSDLIGSPALCNLHRQEGGHERNPGEGPMLGKRIEVSATRADGSEFPIELAVTRISTAGPPLFTAYLRDITERKLAEEARIERSRLAELGRGIGLIIAESATLSEMLNRCAEVTVRLLDAAFARIWLADESGTVLELQASAGIYTHLDGAHARVPIGQYKIGKIAQTRQPHLTNAVLGDPAVHDQEWAKREGMVAFAGYPLMVGDRLIGVWALFARHPLSEAALAEMASVSNGIALGVERKRTAEAVARSEAWLATTLASIGDAVIATDGTGRVRFMNPVAEVLTGWTQREALDRPMEQVFQIINERTRLPVEHPVARVIRDGAIVGLANHTVLIGKGGSETPIEDSAAPIRDDKGDLAGVVMVFRDVTEQRRLELLLADQRRILEQMAQGVSLNEVLDAICVAAERQAAIGGLATILLADDERTHLCFAAGRRCPAEYTKTLGLIPIGPNCGSCGTAAYRNERVIVADIAQDHLWDGYQDLAESYGFRACWSIPIPSSTGHVLGTVAIYFPAPGEPTAHHLQVMEILARTAGMAIERQRGIDQLRKSKEEAERANQAKDQFLAVLSHELRTPLNPILLAASSMLDRPTPPEEIHPTLEMIRHNVNLQARLIDDLLDVMRIVQGKMPLHWGVADCHDVIRHALQVCQSEVFGRTIALTLELNASRHHVNADAARLQQVFWNLIKNAVKFSPEGGSLLIRTRNEGKEADRLIVEVTDTGIGIDPEVLPTIFDPFQQGETSITRKFGGLGLGLAICRGVIEAHGGTIVALSSGRARGATFLIELKALPSREIEENGTPDGKGKGTGGRCHFASVARLKILVVEDEEATRRLMARLLRSLGHEVYTAGTIVEATKAAETVDFDLIVSDIGLPDGSGLELMRRVVADRGAVPAIALTGYGMEEDIVRSREAGFTAHMTKPIDFTKLEAMIRQVAPNGR